MRGLTKIRELWIAPGWRASVIASAVLVGLIAIAIPPVPDNTKEFADRKNTQETKDTANKGKFTPPTPQPSQFPGSGPQNQNIANPGQNTAPSAPTPAPAQFGSGTPAQTVQAEPPKPKKLKPAMSLDDIGEIKSLPEKPVIDNFGVTPSRN